MTGINSERYDSFDQLNQVLLDTRQHLVSADYANCFDQFAPVIASGDAAEFGSQQDPDGSAWAPLARSTIARKGQSKILIRSGALDNSLVSVGGTGNLNSRSARGMLFGTDLAYASFLQHGTAKMPARPVVGMSEETCNRLVNAIADATVEKMKHTLASNGR